MRFLFLTSLILILTGCGPSAQEKKDIAAVTCSVMGESRNMDAAFRVKEINEARSKLGGDVFIDGDEKIKESFEYGLCEQLVLDENYEEALLESKRIARLEEAARRKAEIEWEEKRAEQERIAAEKRAEQERIAAEKRAEQERIAAEKRAEEKRIAAEKKEQLRIAEEKRIEENDRKFATEEKLDFFGMSVGKTSMRVHALGKQKGRDIEIRDRLVKIRSDKVSLAVLESYLSKDLSDSPPAISVTIERNGEEKRRSIAIR